MLFIHWGKSGVIIRLHSKGKKTGGCHHSWPVNQVHRHKSENHKHEHELGNEKQGLEMQEPSDWNKENQPRGLNPNNMHMELRAAALAEKMNT